MTTAKASIPPSRAAIARALGSGRELTPDELGGRHCDRFPGRAGWTPRSPRFAGPARGSRQPLRSSASRPSATCCSTSPIATATAARFGSWPSSARASRRPSRSRSEPFGCARRADGGFGSSRPAWPIEAVRRPRCGSTRHGSPIGFGRGPGCSSPASSSGAAFGSPSMSSSVSIRASTRPGWSPSTRRPRGCHRSESVSGCRRPPSWRAMPSSPCRPSCAPAAGCPGRPMRSWRSTSPNAQPTRNALASGSHSRNCSCTRSHSRPPPNT